MSSATCPSCGSAACDLFYEVDAVPTNSCLLVPDREAALRFPTGDIRLRFCRRCGFIFNAAFRPELTTYSEAYEETQGFSPTFNVFNRDLAERLIERYGLRDRDILEIGCGKGEFLTLLCRLGPNRGVGYDPSFVPERQQDDLEGVRFVRAFFTEATPPPDSDFICCKMTFEHIPDTGRFVHMISEAVDGRDRTVVFFQVPNATRILEEGAFWDVYYEHCSYFSAGALERLFRMAGFAVLDLWTGYDDQYLMIAAEPDRGRAARDSGDEDDLEGTAARVRGFAESVAAGRAAWTRRFERMAAEGRKAVLWGSGSKAVAFLTTLGLRDEVGCVVDINPYRCGKHMPGSGHPIVPADHLASYKPDVVIVMNPVYRDEIARNLAALHLDPEILTV